MKLKHIISAALAALLMLTPISTAFAEEAEVITEEIPLPTLDFTQPSVAVSMDCIEGYTAVIITVPAEKLRLLKEITAEDEDAYLCVQGHFDWKSWVYMSVHDDGDYGIQPCEDDTDATGIFKSWSDYTENGDLISVIMCENSYDFSIAIQKSKACKIMYYIRSGYDYLDGGEDYRTICLTDENLVDIASLNFKKLPNRVYTGKLNKPSVVVKDGNKKLVKGKDYTVTYKTNRRIGTAEVVIAGKGKYIGEKTLKFDIVPPKTKLTVKPRKISKGYQYVTLNWEKSKGADGYEIYYSENGGEYFCLTTVSAETLKLGVKYLVKDSEKFKVRPYTKIYGDTYYGSWSNVVRSGEQKSAG